MPLQLGFSDDRFVVNYSWADQVTDAKGTRVVPMSTQIRLTLQDALDLKRFADTYVGEWAEKVLTARDEKERKDRAELELLRRRVADLESELARD